MAWVIKSTLFLFCCLFFSVNIYVLLSEWGEGISSFVYTDAIVSGN